MKGLLNRGMLPLASVVAVVFSGLAAGPAFASTSSTSSASLLRSLIDTPTSTAACAAPSLTQPFLAAGDSNLYALLPGEAADSFSGTGWTFTGGASIVSTKQADGKSGSVLDLPSGAIAISPPFCVTSSYPTARTEVQDVAGSEGVFVYVSYAATSGWGVPQNTGQVHGQQTAWTLSNPVNIQPGNAPGWQLVRFGLVAGGTSSRFRIYDFYVDPRMTL